MRLNFQQYSSFLMVVGSIDGRDKEFDHTMLYRGHHTSNIPSNITDFVIYFNSYCCTNVDRITIHCYVCSPRERPSSWQHSLKYWFLKHKENHDL